MIMYNLDSGHVFHVAKSGNDANGGLAQQYPIDLASDAKLTINSALSAASSGDTIIIWPGTYSEQIDLLTATKALNIIGTNRKKCIITQASTSKTILTYAGTHLLNLTIEQTGTAMCIDSQSQYDCTFEKCDVFSTGIDGLYCDQASRIKVIGCYIKCDYDVLYVGKSAFIKDSLLVATGLYTGSGMSRALTLDSSGSTIVINTHLIAQPSYEKKTGKGAELYESDRDLYCLKEGGIVILRDCHLIADGTKPAAAHADAYCSGDAYAISGTNLVLIDNCSIISQTDVNQSSTAAYGINNANAQIANSNVEVAGVADSIDYRSGTFRLLNTAYNSAQIAENATLIEGTTGGDVGNAVWDKVLSEHDVAKSAAKYLKQNRGGRY